MKIQKVDNIEDAVKCDKLLTKLIANEALYDKNLRKDYKVNNYFENLYEKKHNVLFIAKDDEDTEIGYAYCKITTVNDGPQIEHVALLDGLYINEECRNKGVATKLIEECKKWAETLGAKIFELNVISENKSALNLYKKLGFSEFEKKMRVGL